MLPTPRCSSLTFPRSPHNVSRNSSISDQGRPSPSLLSASAPSSYDLSLAAWARTPQTIAVHILPGRRVVVRSKLPAIGRISTRCRRAGACLRDAKPLAADIHRTPPRRPRGPAAEAGVATASASDRAIAPTIPSFDIALLHKESRAKPSPSGVRPARGKRRRSRRFQSRAPQHKLFYGLRCRSQHREHREGRQGCEHGAVDADAIRQGPYAHTGSSMLAR
jgi:hypothetical protein